MDWRPLAQRCLALAALPSAIGIGLTTASPRAFAGDVSYAIHAEGAAARMVGERKSEQFGWGGAVLATPELTIGGYFGVEIPFGMMALAEGPLEEEGFVDTEDGSGIFVMPGVRVRPFGRDGYDDLFEEGGLWLATCGGLAFTGELTRPALAARLGYDLSVEPVRFGPFGGYLQIVEADNELRPEDARVVLLGLHGSFEPAPARNGRQVSVEETDPDRDRDGIPNDADRCPDDREDFDRFEDEDGCPEVDNDGDGVFDPSDHCPLVKEDRDRFEDEDGCPDPDNDQDGVLDANDGCSLVPEDPDGFDDDDGCPEADNDQDGIVDNADDCPNDPETFNGYADEDGCPDVEQVRVEGKEIVLDDRVYFRVNLATIEFRSWRLIENIAKLLKANPQYVLVHVQGHADDTGDEAYNQRLSVQRGMAVRDMMIAFGVEPKRLTVQGFGENRPAETGTTVSARRKNRRVEFLILKRTLRKGEAAELSADWLRKAVGPKAQPQPTSPSEPARAPQGAPDRATPRHDPDAGGQSAPPSGQTRRKDEPHGE